VPAHRPSTSTAPPVDRCGAGWVSRRVCANGIVCVSWQQVSVGRGDTTYLDLRDRYCAMAESLGFEGHIVWAEAMR
jgi:hypothetical protein